MLNTKNEINKNKQSMNYHFSSIASKYKSVRTLDLEPVLYIKNQMNGKTKINMADVGCGDGRYSKEFLKYFGDKCFMHCIDYNENMLKSLENYFTEQNITNFCTRQGDANRLPIDNDSLDYIFTFNAIHHFEVQKFLSESLKEHSKMMDIFLSIPDYEIRILEVFGAHNFRYLQRSRLACMNLMN